ncbi:MAG: hypothetical protein ACYC6X_03915 [Minisyncoccota bacterium]
MVQPSSFIASSSLVQTVEPIINAQPNIQALAYDKEVSAPATTTDFAAAGAARSSYSGDLQ